MTKIIATTLVTFGFNCLVAWFAQIAVAEFLERQIPFWPTFCAVYVVVYVAGYAKYNSNLVNHAMNEELIQEFIKKRQP